jgi:hypothetical protein
VTIAKETVQIARATSTFGAFYLALLFVCQCHSQNLVIRQLLAQRINMVITFFSPSTLRSDNIYRLDAGVGEGEDVYMDDDDDFENVKITSPGESITSARAFMR